MNYGNLNVVKHTTPLSVDQCFLFAIVFPRLFLIRHKLDPKNKAETIMKAQVGHC